MVGLAGLTEKPVGKKSIFVDLEVKKRGGVRNSVAMHQSANSMMMTTCPGCW
jgi:hypothetical protein